MSDFVKPVNMLKDNLPQFKGSIKITKRKVPIWARFWQKFGLFKNVGELIHYKEYKNVFVNTGKHSILDRFASTGDTGEITYVALGDGTSTPAATDTALGNELFRKAITSRSRSGTKFYSSTFIASTEGNNTYKEVGLYGDDAAAGSGTGTLYTRAVIDETKSAGESVTIDYDIDAS